MNNLQRAKELAHQAYCDYQGVRNIGLNADHLPFLDEIVTSTYLQAEEKHIDFVGRIATAMEVYDHKTHESGKAVLTMINNLIVAELQSLKQTKE